MKLSILTDCKDIAWLKYILEEFLRINDARFSIDVVPIAAANQIGTTNKIFYTRQFPGSEFWIPNRSSENVISDHGIRDKITILKQCASVDTRGLFDFDILFNSFVLLSRKLEYQEEQKGKQIRSYRQRLSLLSEKVFANPSVNLQFDLLEQLIGRLFPELRFGNGNPFSVELSHDLDYLEKTTQLRLKQSAFNVFNALRRITRPSYALKQLGRSISFFFTDSDYWNFEYWTHLESSYNMKSVFYVYSCADDQSLKTWIMDPSYNVSKHIDLQDQLKEMINEGFEIGLHGSINSYNKLELLRTERDLLANAIGHEVIKSRQHWLMYSENITPQIHEHLFKFDSTLAWNDCMGFRSSCCSRYRPYNHKNSRPFNYLITPQIVMDSQLFDYAADGGESAYAKAEELLRKSVQHKNCYVSISWHPRTNHPEYNWQGPYESLIAKINSLKS